jgi:endonuclease-3
MKQRRAKKERKSAAATRPRRATTSTKRSSAGPRTHRPYEDLEVDLPIVSPAKRSRALSLLGALRKAYPDAHCELDYRSPHELLVATILSAQTTDISVNKATPALFARFPTPQAFARATPEEIEPFVRTLGLFRNKAKAIHLSMKEIVEKHAGEVPRTMEELLELHGVARKTAGVVLGNCFNINVGVVVDTHVQRLSRRLDLAPEDASVATIERWLMAQFPRDAWCDLSHLLIFHGRRACKARNVPCCGNPICTEFGVRCELRVSAARRN